MEKNNIEDLLAVTGPITVINLPYRGDRRDEFSVQLQKVGLSLNSSQVQIFSAVRPSEAAGFPTIGTRGCFLSHLGILRDAIANGQERVLMCEDDLDFSPDILVRLPSLVALLHHEKWDLFYGGYQSLPAGRMIATGLVEANPESSIGATHFYAVRGTAIRDLVCYLEAILTRPPGDPDGGPMHVDGAISRFRADHPHYRTLVATPPIGVQRPSRTDIHMLKWFDRLPIVRNLVGVVRRARTRAR